MMEEAVADRFSDRGSTPLRSTKKRRVYASFFFVDLRRVEFYNRNLCFRQGANPFLFFYKKYLPYQEMRFMIILGYFVHIYTEVIWE